MRFKAVACRVAVVPSLDEGDGKGRDGSRRRVSP